MRVSVIVSGRGKGGRTPAAGRWLPWLGLLSGLLLGAACGEAPPASSGDGVTVTEAVADHPMASDAATARVDSSAGAPAERPRAADAAGTEDADGVGTRVVLCLGDSLTAGYGLEPEQAWPARLDARARTRGWPLRFVNAGLSGETTSGGRARLDWLLANHAPGDIEAVVVALGGNDGLRGIPLETMEGNLDAILEDVAAAAPDALLVLAGMQSPPNMGRDYTEAFAAVFPRVAGRHEALLVPFLLEGVGGVPELNQRDGIHPTAAGQRILADNVWAILAPHLEARVVAPVGDDTLEPAGAGR